jgi:hypothetical protein
VGTRTKEIEERTGEEVMANEWLGGVLIIAQIVMLVAYYGFGLMATAPWWVIWLPGLIIACILGLVILFILVIAVIVMIAN